METQDSQLTFGTLASQADGRCLAGFVRAAQLCVAIAQRAIFGRWRKVLTGYVSEAHEAARWKQVASASEEREHGLLQAIIKAPTQQMTAPFGLGEHWLFRGGVVGFALFALGRCRHLYVFPSEM